MKAQFLVVASVVLVVGGLFYWAFQPATSGPSPVPGTPRSVSWANGTLAVDGAPLEWVRCVDYQPIPVGFSRLAGYHWAHWPETYRADWAALRALGANTLKVPVSAAAKTSEMTSFLRESDAQGFNVILTIEGPAPHDAGNDAARADLLARVDDAARSFGRERAVILWQVGNEIDYQYQGSDVADWYALLDRAATELATIDPNHPVLTANNPATDPAIFASKSPHVPIFGANLYPVRENEMRSALERIAAVARGRPVLVTEFGTDAFDSNRSAEDEATQARVVVADWRGIVDARGAGVRVIGGCVFEWTDQWWKRGSPSSHDTTADWFPYVKGELPDDAYSEEWFGITRNSADPTARAPREAYAALAREWGDSPAHGPGR